MKICLTYGWRSVFNPLRWHCQVAHLPSSRRELTIWLGPFYIAF